MHRGLQYRPDIEGLRAVAILLVVAAHAHVPGLAGGFIGVDVFFVLSGYLISSLLRKELESTGRIDFMAFYARRLRRLGPALVTVVAVTCVMALAVLPPVELRGQLASAGTALAWVSNIYFTFSGHGYFDATSETNLFLHTWSLGVEEQFYLAWPLLMLLAFKRQTLVMCAILIASLIACIYVTSKNPNFAFYMTPTRAWQFAFGALMVGRKFPAIAGVVGLGLILGSSLVFDSSTTYPGLQALAPTLGAAMILASEGRVSSFLAIGPLQSIGRVSYSWYLWHWPVLLLGPALLPSTPWRQAALVATSFALAACSFHFIERPIRRNTRIIQPPRTFVLGSIAALLAGSAVAHAWMGTLPRQNSEPMTFELPDVYKKGCDSYYENADVVPCEFGDPASTKTAVIFGDSIAMQWFPAMQAAFTSNGWKLVAITKSACPMVDAPVYNKRIRREYTECEQWRNDSIQRIAQMHPDLVVAGSSHWYEFSDSQWRDGTESVFKKLSASAPTTIMIASTPKTPFNGPSCLESDNLGACKGKEEPSDRERIEELRSDSARLTGVHVIDMSDVVCPNGLCNAEIDGIPVFRDTQHLTPAFVRARAHILIARMSVGLKSNKN